jgi:hypothetical protein
MVSCDGFFFWGESDVRERRADGRVATRQSETKNQKSRRRRLAFVPRPRQVGNHRQM